MFAQGSQDNGKYRVKLINKFKEAEEYAENQMEYRSYIFTLEDANQYLGQVLEAPGRTVKAMLG